MATRSEVMKLRWADPEYARRIKENLAKHASDGGKASAGTTTHGLSGTPEYTSWKGMKERCLNTRHKKFKNYGARGITVCERWMNSFDNFLADMGPKPEPKRDYSIERKNNDGNYEPGNCKWATQDEQQKNRRPQSYRPVASEASKAKMAASAKLRWARAREMKSERRTLVGNPEIWN
jgi:hypothetical protein